jgi:hypothetical protein
MKTVSILAIAGLATAASAQWYNGDANRVNGLSAESNTGLGDTFTFDDFDHGGGTITDIYGNFYSSTGITGYIYEIRSGVSNGFGGTLHASGNANTDGPYSKVPNGWNDFGFTGYTISADINDVNLPAGTYFLALSEVGNGGGRAFVQTTSGANSVGTPGGNNDNSFFNSSFFGINYGPARDQLGTNPTDFSYGVNVPAPASVALLGLGALVARRRR